MQMHTKTVRSLFATHPVCSALKFGRLRPSGKQARLRKFLATLMLVLFGGFYAAPLVQATSSDPESSLPACCRRHGHHHCATVDQVMMATSSSGPQIGQTPQHCPFYPHSTTAPVVRSHPGLAPSAAFFANIVSHPAVQPQVRAVYRLSLDRSRQKRGPPALPIL